MTNNNLFSLAELACIRVKGEGAGKLLQGQLTCHMDNIPEHGLQLAAQCNPQGRMIYSCHVFIYQNDYHLLLPKNMVNIAIAALKKYAMFYKVDIQEINTLFITGLIDKTAMTDATVYQYGIHESRYIAISDKPPSMQSDVNAWHRLNIEEGLAFIYPETSSVLLPHEINFPQLGGIHFEKGCYTGQEIIARMQYRGKLKKHLHKALISASTPPSLAESIDIQTDAEKKSVGLIVDFVEAAYNQYISLILIEDDYAEMPLYTNNQHARITII